MREDFENRVDDYFREGLDNLNVIPPAEVWNNIADKLPVKKKSRKAFLWIAAAASVSLFAAMSGWYYLNRAGGEANTGQVVQIAANPGQDTKKTDVATPGVVKNQANNTTENSNISGNVDTSVKVETGHKSNSGEQVANAVTNNAMSVSNGKEQNTGTPSKIEFPVKESTEIPGDYIQANPSQEIKLLAALPLKGLDVPKLSGKIETGTITVKLDTVSMYENIYAYMEPDLTKEKINRWAIGGQMAPLYSYRNVSDVNVPGISKTSMDKVENAVVTYAGGVNVDYSVSSRLTFQTGIYYMKMGQEIDNITTLTHPKAARMVQANNSAKLEYASASPVSLNSTGTIITASTPELYAQGSQTFDNTEYRVGNMVAAPADLSQKDIEQSFEFIEVPFLAKYKIIDRKINLHLLGGLSTHVLVNNTAKLVSDDNFTDYGKTADVETFNYSSSVGFGVVYNLSSKLLLSVEPTFKYYLNSFNSSNDIRLHPYAFGIYSGVSFKF